MSYYKPKPIKGCSVLVQNDQVDKALRKFKKKIQELGLLEEIKERQFYEKPTTARKRKKGAAQARWRKKLREQELPKKLY
jgi:small subunit ribosomal protein S21